MTSKGKKRPATILISTVLLFVCGIFGMWAGSRVVVIRPIGEGLIVLGDLWGVIDLSIGIVFLLSGYFIFKLDSLQTSGFIALFSGLTLTILFYMTDVTGFTLLLEGLVPLIAGLIALRELTELQKKMWLRRIKGFWTGFSHNKLGILGLGLLSIYIAIAFLQPLLITHDPLTPRLANKYAMPEWMAIVNPAYQNLPRTTDYSLDWNWNETSLPKEVKINWNSTETGKEWTIQYEGNETIVVPLLLKFNYSYDPPKDFYYEFAWSAKPEVDVFRRATAKYSLEINLTTPDGTVFPLWDQHWWDYRTGVCSLLNPYYKPEVDPLDMKWYPGGQYPQHRKYGYLYYWHYMGENVQGWSASEGTNYVLQSCYVVYKERGIPIPTWEKTQSNKHVHYTTDFFPPMRLGYEGLDTIEMTRDLFSPSGEFTMTLYVTFEPTQPNGSCQVTITNFKIHVPGLLWGLLGTDTRGCDVWSRVISGTRVSLAVGLSAAIIATTIGILGGIIAGYLGGAVDEVLMRIVDILLCIPPLPFIVMLVAMWGLSIFYIILLVALFGWLGLSRLIRSQVLSLREMPFIECAKASGAPNFYIMLRHILPNVTPIIISDLILTVPGAILLEAALSFLGLGDPRIPTWGREYAIIQMTGAYYEAWWWVLPPGIAITGLCVAFIFIGHALDEILNPRLRRRR